MSLLLLLDEAAGDVNAQAGVASASGTASNGALSVAPNTGAGSASGTAGAAAGSISGASGSASGTGSVGGPSGSLAIGGTGAGSGTGSAFDATVVVGTLINAEVASATGSAGNGAGAIANGSGAGSASGTASGPAGSLSSSAGAGSASGSAGAPAGSLKPTAGAGSATGSAFNATVVGEGLFATSISANGRYLRDQNGDPYFIQGNSPQNLVTAAASLSDIGTFFADQEGRGFNSSQIHLVYNFQTDWDGNNPFGNNATFGSPVEAYWANIDALFDKAETYGLTIWATVLDNITCGSTVAAATDANCFAYGQFLGNRYKTRVNLIWTIGNDYDSSQWTARDPKYKKIMDGIRDQGDTHPMTLWLNTAPSTDNSGWDTYNDIVLCYEYDTPPYFQIDETYNITRTADYPMPTFWGEGTYYGEKNASTTPPLSTNLELRKLAWWTITWGGCGHFFGTHEVWQFGNWSSETGAAIYAHLAHIPTVFAGLSGWQSLVPDASHVFQTGGRGTFEGGTLDSDTFSTAAFINGGLLAVVYFPSSRGSITFDTTKLSGTVTAYWLDPTNASTTTESTPSAPTHPGNNAGGDPDWVLVFQGTPVVNAAAGLASGTGSAGNAAGSISGASGGGSASGSAGGPAGSLKPSAGAGTASGSAFDATISTSSNVTVNAGLASATGTAGAAATSIAGTSGSSSGTGTSGAPAGSLAISAGAGSATGSAFGATVSTESNVQAAAGLASATGSGKDVATSIAGTSGSSSGTGAAGAPAGSLSVNAGAGSATGSASSASISAGIGAGFGSGTGSANVTSGMIVVNPSLATAAGAAFNAAVSTSANVNANAGLASATGTGRDVSASIAGTSGHASGTGTGSTPATALAASAALSSASGSGFNATITVGITVVAGVASGLGSASATTGKIELHPGLATAAGAAYNATAFTGHAMPTAIDHLYVICIDDIAVVLVDGPVCVRI